MEVPPPGSNLLCSNNDNDDDGSNVLRIRKEWNHLDNYGRELYLDAVETAIERGLHQRFAIFHADEISEIQAHDTCGFYLWHRIFVLAYENMLRSLEPRFACLTLPFWDIYRDYEKQESSTNSCRSYATCSKIINDFGGIVDNDDFEDRTFFGRKVDGLWYYKAPIQNLRDDNNKVGMIRYDMWFDPITEEVENVLSVENITRVFGMKDRVAFWEVLHHGIHDSVHDTIGGFMRTPASAIDPLFMPWHSTMELFDYVWEACHSATTNDETAQNYTIRETDCIYSPKAMKRFRNISLSTDEAYIKLDNTMDIRDDPSIGSYFLQAMKFSDLWTIWDFDEHNRFRYANLPQNFVLALENNTQACPNGLSSILGAEDDSGLGRREPPRFSNGQLDALKQNWIQEAQAYYKGNAGIDNSEAISTNNSFPNLHKEGHALLQMKFVECLLFEAMDRDTIERWAIDEGAFLKQVVVNERYKTHPLCRDRLFDVSGLDRSGDSGDSPSAFPNATVIPDATIASSGGVYHQGGLNDSYSFSTFLLICLVLKFSR